MYINMSSKIACFVVGLTKKDIIGNSLSFFTAGYETTATALQFLLYNLALHPDIQEKVSIITDLTL